MRNGDDMVLTPRISHILVAHPALLPLLCLSLLFMGYDESLVRAIASLAFLLSLLWGLLRLWYLSSVSWTVTDHQLIHTHGVLHRSVGYLELYRIYDYAESQSLLEQILRIKTITLMSGDRSDPKMRLYGIDARTDLISFMRAKVEQCKKDKDIYEITNR